MKPPAAALAALLVISCSSQDKAANGSAETNAGAPAVQAAAAGPAATAIAFEPGQWEITVEILRASMPNMPAGATPPPQPPIIVRHCLTPEQAARPNANFLTGSSDTAGCTSENLTMRGGRLQGVVQCNSEGNTMRSTLDGQFTPTSYALDTQVHTVSAGMTMDLATRTSARRTGDCPG